MSGRLQPYHGAVWKMAMHEFADDFWRDTVIGTLKNERGHAHQREIGTVVRQKRDARKMFCNFRIRSAKAIRQLRREFWPVLILHDDRGHSAGPSEVVFIQRLQKGMYVALVESPDVLPLVNVAG